MIALALGLVAGLAFFSSRALRSDAPSQPASVSAPPAAEMVSVTIAYGPAGATAKLDGSALGPSPFSAKVAKDGSMHTLEVALPGGQPVNQKLVFDRDVSVSIMAPEPAPTAAEPAAASATASASAAPAKAEPVRGPGPGGDDPKKKQRPIDTDNPYRTP